MRQINLKGLFTPQAVATALEELPPIKSTVMDLAFPSSKNHEFPHIGISEIQRVIRTIPLVKRDGTNVKLGSTGSEAHLFAPLPVMPSIEITAAELNDLSLLSPMSKQDWITAKIDELRQIVRKTTEAMSSVVLMTGKLSWPIRLSGGGIGNFEVIYGTPLSYTPDKMWDAIDANIMTVYDTLTDMDEALQEAGFGGKVEFMAGKTVFGHAMRIAQAWAAAGQFSPFEIKLEDGCISLGGYKLYRMSERYDNPLDQSIQTPKVGPKKLVAYVKDAANAKIYYCAVDSLSAANRALPFHVFTEEKGDTAIEMTAQAKPVPARNPKTVNIAQVVS